MQIVNIAAYKFVGIPDPAAWQPVLKERCDALHLKGTVLLATEGINLFLAGSRDAIDDFFEISANRRVLWRTLRRTRGKGKLFHKSAFPQNGGAYCSGDHHNAPSNDSTRVSTRTTRRCSYT